MEQQIFKDLFFYLYFLIQYITMHTCIYFKEGTIFSFEIFLKTFRISPIKKNRGRVYIKIYLFSQMFILHYIKIFNKSSVA